MEKVAVSRGATREVGSDAAGLLAQIVAIAADDVEEEGENSGGGGGIDAEVLR